MYVQNYKHHNPKTGRVRAWLHNNGPTVGHDENLNSGQKAEQTTSQSLSSFFEPCSRGLTVITCGAGV